MHNYKFLINLSHFYVKLIKVSHCDSRSSRQFKTSLRLQQRKS